jgi:hypothetical protein
MATLKKKFDISIEQLDGKITTIKHQLDGKIKTTKAELESAITDGDNSTVKYPHKKAIHAAYSDRSETAFAKEGKELVASAAELKKSETTKK